MSGKLIISYSMEKEICKELSIKTGNFYHCYYTFATEFSELSEEARELIYEHVYQSGDKDDENLYLDFTILKKHYEELENVGFPFKKFVIDETFFTGQQADSFIRHFYEVKRWVKEHKVSSEQVNSGNASDYPSLKILYTLHPDYVKAKEMIDDKIILSTQTLKVSLHKIPEDLYHEIAQFIVKDGEEIILDFSQYEVDEELYAKKPYKYFNDNVILFIKNSIQYLKNKNNKKDISLKEKKEWIEQYASPHLRRAFERGYNCQRQYVMERVKKEFEGFELDFEGESKTKERPFPTEKALDIEDELKEKCPNMQTRVVWMQKPLKEVEVLMIYDYLGKYSLYKVIE